MSSKTITGFRPGLAPPEVSVAHYALNVVAATPQILRAATTHGCPKKPLGLSSRRSVTIAVDICNTILFLMLKANCKKSWVLGMKRIIFIPKCSQDFLKKMHGFLKKQLHIKGLLHV